MIRMNILPVGSDDSFPPARSLIEKATALASASGDVAGAVTHAVTSHTAEAARTSDIRGHAVTPPIPRVLPSCTFSGASAKQAHRGNGAGPRPDQSRPGCVCRSSAVPGTDHGGSLRPARDEVVAHHTRPGTARVPGLVDLPCRFGPALARPEHPVDTVL